MPVIPPFVTLINTIVDHVAQHSKPPDLAALDKAEPFLAQIDDDWSIRQHHSKVAMRSVVRVGAEKAKLGMMIMLMTEETVERDLLREIGLGICLGSWSDPVPWEKTAGGRTPWEMFQTIWPHLSAEAQNQIISISGGANWMASTEWRR